MRPWRRAEAELQAAVRAALSYEDALCSKEIDVRARNEVVTLTGHVDRASTRDRAGGVALYVPGVWRVRNRLTSPDGR